MSDNSPIHAAGTLTRQDIVRFNFFQLFRRFWYLFAILLLPPLLGMVAMFAPDIPEEEKTAPSVFVFPLVMSALVIVLVYFQARRQYDKLAFLKEPMRFSFSDAGMHLEGANFTTDMNWSLIKSIREVKTGFLIYQSANQAWLLPKRFFSDDETQIEQGRKFMQAHLVKPAKFHPSGFVGRWF